MKKKIYFIALICSILTSTYTKITAQIIEPVKWTATVDKVEKGTAELVMTANIEKGWHVYSQFLPDGGPIKTTFTFTPSDSFELVGEVAEGKPTEFYDKNFEMQLKYFSVKAEFSQKIKLKSKSDFKIEGNVEFMVCDDEKCLPPNVVDLKFEVKK